MHLIMGAVSLWTRPPGPAPMCRALKIHPHPSKHSARCIVTGNTSLAHVTARNKREAVFLAIPAMMPSIVGVPTREESTARGALHVQPLPSA